MTSPLHAVLPYISTARNYSSPDGPRFECHHGHASRHDRVLRVVTFNIEFGARVARAIEALEADPRLRTADILALQEMDAEGVERIARARALNSVYFPSAVHPQSGRDYGTALLSPWPIVGSRKVLLPHLSWGARMQRVATCATVVVSGRRIQAYSVHLETPFHLRWKARRDQLRAVIEDARRFDGPVVIAGDLNSSGLPRDAEQGGFHWLTRNVWATVGFVRRDHLFTRGLVRSGAFIAGVAASLGASDHRPVWAELRLAS